MIMWDKLSEKEFAEKVGKANLTTCLSILDKFDYVLSQENYDFLCERIETLENEGVDEEYVIGPEEEKVLMEINGF